MVSMRVRWCVGGHTLRLQSRMDHFKLPIYLAPRPHPKHSCRDKRLIRKLVLTGRLVQASDWKSGQKQPGEVERGGGEPQRGGDEC